MKWPNVNEYFKRHEFVMKMCWLGRQQCLSNYQLHAHTQLILDTGQYGDSTGSSGG